MEFTWIATWLNTAFASFDFAIMNAMHSLARTTGGILTPVMKGISLIGEKGLLMFLAAAILMCFSTTRKTGICLFGAVCCGALISNVLIKDEVARLRPFESGTIFQSWWHYIGAPFEEDFSFPSGHVTAAMSGIMALYFARGKKFLIPAVVYVLLMSISRIYLMVHYPSDVIAALLIGLFSAGIAYTITRNTYKILVKYQKIRFCSFVLKFDLRHLISHLLMSDSIQ